MNDFAHAPDTVTLGDLTVKRLGFGAMQLPGAGVWGEPKDPARAKAVLRRAVDLGMNLIDTAWYYGPDVSNRLIKEVLHPYPKGLVLVTKLGGKRLSDKGWAPAITPEELRKGNETDLRQLGVDHVDVTHLRWMPHASVPFAEALDTMIDLKKQGKIRHIGLSSVTQAQLEEALTKTPIVSLSNLYNVAVGEKKLGQVAHMETEGQEKLVDFCADHGIAYLPFFPLSLPFTKVAAPAVEAVAKERGATTTQVALAWLLARSKTMAPIPGTSSPEHLEENWKARSIALTREEIARIAEARD